MRLTVLIPTYNRPECIRRNLESLSVQEPPPDQIIVIDASQDGRTQRVVQDFPNVTYLRNEHGRGNTPNSRNMGLAIATGNVIAFLDDDAFVHPGWTKHLLDTYMDPTVGGVAGRALNNLPGEATVGLDEIGKLKPNGFLTGNFAADPGCLVDVDHMIGCNMSLRREVLGQLGGFKDDYPAGPFGICEETEICVRAKRLGHRLVFNPLVCVDHIGAPQPGGRRFGPRYSYYHTRNVIVMLLRNYGAGPVVLRHAAALAACLACDFCRRIGAAMAHICAAVAGGIAGLTAGVRLMIGSGRDPVRRDTVGQAISTALGRPQPEADKDEFCDKGTAYQSIARH